MLARVATLRIQLIKIQHKYIVQKILYNSETVHPHIDNDLDKVVRSNRGTEAPK